MTMVGSVVRAQGSPWMMLDQILYLAHSGYRLKTLSTGDLSAVSRHPITAVWKH